MTTNKDTVSVIDLIDNNAFQNEKAYNLSKALLDIAAQARSIIQTGEENISGDGKMFISNVNDWMEKINKIANDAVRQEMLTK